MSDQSDTASTTLNGKGSEPCEGQPPIPNVFAWWTPIEAQEVRAAGPGEWSPGDGYD
jgi:hypothetical protein